MTTNIGRPKFNDEMLKELADIVCSIVNADQDDESVIDEIVQTLKHHYNDDGYELAKQLEDIGYDIDVSVVCDLDRISNNSHEILQRHVKNWVINNNIAPELKEGDGVILKNKIKGQAAGVIISVRPETAEYGIHISAISSSPNSQYIVKYEDVTLITD